jgi:hypothetical protein
MKLSLLMMTLMLSSASFGASKTIAQCTVNKVSGGEGARVNLLQTEDGQYKANLIFGTTVSGQSFQVSQISAGVFVGSIRNKPQFPIKLVISSLGKVNSYVNGYAASLEAAYVDLRNPNGMGSVKTTDADGFVCGKIISRF